ncbi:MAG TPA: hypothetical protein VHA07_00410 [Devosia sp.]|nr:hypothetical protein [Devosia sp.]
MLFHPPVEENLGAVAARLDRWDAEADALRVAAIAARHGEPAAETTVATAEEALADLRRLLDQLDHALLSMPAGDPAFATILLARIRAAGLGESVANSLDMLDRCAIVQAPQPRLIAHAAELGVAA